MENTSSLYDTLVQVLSHHANWLDFRHLKTLAWMMVGLIHSSSISLCAWTPLVVSRAQYSQSIVRRFRRWLDNDKIEGPRSWDRPLYAFRGGLSGAGASSTDSKIAANIERGF